MPGWLKTTLLAAGLLIGAAFLAEPVLAVRRRRQAVSRAVTGAAAAGAGGTGSPATAAGPGQAGLPVPCLRRSRPGRRMGRLPRAGPASWWLITPGWW